MSYAVDAMFRKSLPMSMPFVKYLAFLNINLPSFSLLNLCRSQVIKAFFFAKLKTFKII